MDLLMTAWYEHGHLMTTDDVIRTMLSCNWLAKMPVTRRRYKPQATSCPVLINQLDGGADQTLKGLSTQD